MTQHDSNPQAMMAADRASASLGIGVDALGPGTATVSLVVRQDMLNGFAITHGGLVFALADTAFALACNDGGAPVVAAGADITFLKASTSGALLTATAARRSERGRTSLVDVTVTDGDGDVVAEFRGRSRRTSGSGLAAASSPASSASTEQEHNKAVIRRFNREFMQGGDESVFHETVAPDFVNRSPQDPAAAGPEAAFFFFTKVLRVAFPDLTVTIHDQVAEGDEVVTRKSYTGTHSAPFLGVPATGRRVEFTVTDIIRLRDGRYVEHWANADMAGLHQQLVAPARA